MLNQVACEAYVHIKTSTMDEKRKFRNVGQWGRALQKNSPLINRNEHTLFKYNQK